MVLGVMVVVSVGVMSFYEICCLSVTEVEVQCLGVTFGLVGDVK